MKVTRVYGASSGETHLEEVEVADGFAAVIPAVGVRVSFARPRHLEFHAAPKRGLVVAIHGEYEIVTTSGDRKRFRQGEWLLADDVGTNGHTSEAFGADSQLLHCEVPAEWAGWTYRG